MLTCRSLLKNRVYNVDLYGEDTLLDCDIFGNKPAGEHARDLLD